MTLQKYLGLRSYAVVKTELRLFSLKSNEISWKVLVKQMVDTIRFTFLKYHPSFRTENRLERVKVHSE